MQIRPTLSADIPALQNVLDQTELFPSEMLPQMIAGFLSGNAEDEIWLTAHDAGQAQGFCFASPEALTDGTWNMRAIAVAPQMQGQGHGRAITRQLEADLTARKQRVLIVDTSGTQAFARTRAFYAGNGYVQEATLRDFWAEGDDKVIFRKALG